MKRKIKNIFFTGLVVIIPVGLTIYILIFIVNVMDSLLTIIPDKYQPDTLLNVHIPGLGIIVTVILIFIIGLLTKSYLGNQIVKWGEAFVDKIPVIRSIYQATKQIVDGMVMGKSRSFQRAILVEFPRKGLYTIGFVTGIPSEYIQEKIGQNFISIYVPTTPNPTSGYYIIVSEDEITYLDISVEEAFTLVITTGMVNPMNHLKNK